MTGWIALHRSIQNHWIWSDPEKLKWWIDLILLANHQPNEIMLNSEVVTIERGERHTSEIILANRWGVSRNTVRKFLRVLEKENMIKVKKSRQSGTTYKVLNYNVYQGKYDIKKQNAEHRKNNGVNNKININNNGNNRNNDNKNNIPYKDIIDYLNKKASRNYKHTTAKNKNIIKARWEEGFSLNDFKKVIDIKVTEWKNNEMSKYLRPETLFGPKFDSYLNQESIEYNKTDERYSNLPI